MKTNLIGATLGALALGVVFRQAHRLLTFQPA